MDSTLKDMLTAAGATVIGEGPKAAAAHFGDAAAEYEALTGAVGLADLTCRTQIELTGADRQSFLHNMSTNDIRRLTPGTGCEAFLCNAQGHTLGLVNVFCGGDSLVVETAAEQQARLLAHLDRHLIREKVELKGRSENWAEWLVAGPGADDLLRPLVGELPARLLDHCAARIADAEVSVRRVDFTRPHGYLVSSARSAAAHVWEALRHSGARPCGSEALEMARIEAGTPLYGLDVTDANLPQEVGRNERAISFVKGCYIGQETVARLDALGHVNRTLRGLRFDGAEVPAEGLQLTGEAGKQAAQVTSAAFSPRLKAPLALAYVRRGMNAPGTRLDSPFGPAEVVALPV